jgi:hypothetical protein
LVDSESSLVAACAGEAKNRIDRHISDMRDVRHTLFRTSIEWRFHDRREFCHARAVTPKPGLGVNRVAERRIAARVALQRHARATAALFQAQESRMTLAELDRKGLIADELEEVRQARRGLKRSTRTTRATLETAWRPPRMASLPRMGELTNELLRPYPLRGS